MPHSANNQIDPENCSGDSLGNSPDKPSGNPDGKDFAILVESLYVANLLILPGFAYLYLIYLFLTKHGKLPPLARSHLEQTMAASIWIVIIFFIAALTTMTLNTIGIEDLTLWILVIITFTIIHATMVLLGVIGLSKALSGKCWKYPIVGKPLPRNCRQ